MCKLCLQDKNYRRHDPRINSDRPHPIPPEEHGSLSGLRRHWGAGELPCDECDAYYKTPEYERDRLTYALGKVNHRLGSYIEDDGEPDYRIEDPERRAFLERRREKIERQLRGEVRKPRERKAEPTKTLGVRFPVRLVEEIEEMAEEKGTTVSAIVRQIVESHLLIGDM